MAERIILQDNENSIKEAVKKAAAVLENGGIILYPTDTVYGLGVDVCNEDAVKALYSLKGREYNKPMHGIVANLEMADQYVHVNKEAIKLGNSFFPSPLTLILKKRDNIPNIAVSESGTFGIRIPDNTFCIELAKKFGRPYTTTSANISGDEPMLLVDDILNQLGDRGDGIDLIVDQGNLPKSKPSTIVDISSHNLDILREGEITEKDVERVLYLQ